MAGCRARASRRRARAPAACRTPRARRSPPCATRPAAAGSRAGASSRSATVGAISAHGRSTNPAGSGCAPRQLARHQARQIASSPSRHATRSAPPTSRRPPAPAAPRRRRRRAAARRAARSPRQTTPAGDRTRAQMGRLVFGSIGLSVQQVVEARRWPGPG